MCTQMHAHVCVHVYDAYTIIIRRVTIRAHTMLLHHLHMYRIICTYIFQMYVYMCVYIYIHTNVCMCMCVYIYVHTRMYACVCVYVYVEYTVGLDVSLFRLAVFSYIMFSYLCVYVNVYVNVRMCVYIYMYICIYVYICIYI